MVGIAAYDPFPDLTLRRLPRHDRAAHGFFTQVQAELRLTFVFIRPVTGITFGSEDGADVAVELHRHIGTGCDHREKGKK